MSCLTRKVWQTYTDTNWEEAGALWYGKENPEDIGYPSKNQLLEMPAISTAGQKSLMKACLDVLCQKCVRPETSSQHDKDVAPAVLPVHPNYRSSD